MEVPENNELGLGDTPRQNALIGDLPVQRRDLFNAKGKEVLFKNQHYADARDERCAGLIVEALNSYWSQATRENNQIDGYQG